jgi:hypothetical protein
VSTYQRYGDGCPTGSSLVDRGLRRVARIVGTRTKGTVGAIRPFPVEASTQCDDHVRSSRAAPIFLHTDRGVDSPRGERRRGGWASRFLRRSPIPPEPGERYKIDPQFVPRSLERVT